MKIFLSFILCVFLISCKQTVKYYEEPQPIDTKNLNEIPKLLQGHYLNIKDKSKLVISHNLIKSYPVFNDKTLQKKVALSDTLFYLSEKNIIRKVTGFYFLNLMKKDKSWNVNKLELSKDKLTINSLFKEIGITSSEQIEETKQDTFVRVNPK